MRCFPRNGNVADALHVGFASMSVCGGCSDIVADDFTCSFVSMPLRHCKMRRELYGCYLLRWMVQTAKVCHNVMSKMNVSGIVFCAIFICWQFHCLRGAPVEICFLFCSEL